MNVTKQISFTVFFIWSAKTHLHWQISLLSKTNEIFQIPVPLVTDTWLFAVYKLISDSFILTGYLLPLVLMIFTIFHLMCHYFRPLCDSAVALTASRGAKHGKLHSVALKIVVSAFQWSFHLKLTQNRYFPRRASDKTVWYLNTLCIFNMMWELFWVSLLKYCTHEMRAFSRHWSRAVGGAAQTEAPPTRMRTAALEGNMNDLNPFV